MFAEVGENGTLGTLANEVAQVGFVIGLILWGWPLFNSLWGVCGVPIFEATHDRNSFIRIGQPEHDLKKVDPMIFAEPLGKDWWSLSERGKSFLDLEKTMLDYRRRFQVKPPGADAEHPKGSGDDVPVDPSGVREKSVQGHADSNVIEMGGGDYLAPKQFLRVSILEFLVNIADPVVSMKKVDQEGDHALTEGTRTLGITVSTDSMILRRSNTP